jgi:hypothetical protein
VILSVLGAGRYLAVIGLLALRLGTLMRARRARSPPSSA